MWDTWTWILNNWGMWRKDKWKVMPRMQSAMTMIVRVRSRIEMTCSIRLNHNCDIFGDSGCAGNWISNIINLLSIDDTLKLIGRLEKEWQLLISKVSHWPELHWSRILKIKGYKGYKFSYPACLSWKCSSHPGIIFQCFTRCDPVFPYLTYILRGNVGQWNSEERGVVFNNHIKFTFAHLFFLWLNDLTSCSQFINVWFPSRHTIVDLILFPAHKFHLCEQLKEFSRKRGPRK